MPQCLTPMDIRIKDTNEIKAVPCGKCVACVLRKGSEWSFRIMQEERGASSAFFITLTYDNDNVPITPKKFMGLSYPRTCLNTGKAIGSDLQNFFKLLRRNTQYAELTARTPKTSRNAVELFFSPYRKVKQPIKYYAVGEYGGRTNRPHYHAIVFNADPELILKSWQLGKIHFGTVTPASVGYCMKYMLKKGHIPAHANDDRYPEYACMSKNLGIGYITPETILWHHASLDRLYCPIPGGVKISMPRYYKTKMLDPAFREAAGKLQLSRMQALEDKYTPYEYRISNPEYYQAVNYAKIAAVANGNDIKQYLSQKNEVL